MKIKTQLKALSKELATGTLVIIIISFQVVPIELWTHKIKKHFDFKIYTTFYYCTYLFGKSQLRDIKYIKI